MLSAKLGKHTQYWGESILAFAHGNSYGQSGLDISKALAVPGTEAKELFIPRNQLSTSFTVSPELTLGAQYFLDWDASRLPESGTYLGFNDGIQNGGHNLSLIGGVNPFFGAPGADRRQPVFAPEQWPYLHPGQARRLRSDGQMEPGMAGRHARRLLPQHLRHLAQRGPATDRRRPGATDLRQCRQLQPVLRR